jgi:hypothetical protein
VHNTVQNPFQDVMAQHGVCSKGQTLRPMVNIGRAEGHATVALHCRGVGGQNAGGGGGGSGGGEVGLLHS